MKQVLFACCLLLTARVCAQPKDYRAKLAVEGLADELTVLPNGTLWLTTITGNTYYARHIDSNWHYGPRLADTASDRNLSDRFGRIDCFNRDTALLTGELYPPGTPSQASGYLRTTDGGKHWQQLDFGYSTRVHTSVTDKEGNAWLGATKCILYTNDFGLQWKQLPIPMRHSRYVRSLNMRDNRNGICGTDDNELYQTRDNWQTTQAVPAPFDQLTYASLKASRNISKIVYWGPYLVCDQYGDVFFTDTAHIAWQPFLINIVSFTADDQGGLYVVNDSLQVLRYTSPQNYETILPRAMPHLPIDLKYAAGALYALATNNELYKINKTGLVRNRMYTTDHPIDTMELGLSGNKQRWGFSDDEIYLRSNKGNWYREQSLNFRIEDFSVADDNTALLWDGHNNYRYTLQDHQLHPAATKGILDSFLAYPVKAVLFTGGGSGCFHHNESSIIYTPDIAGGLQCTEMRTDATGEISVKPFRQNINPAYLEGLLHRINSNPEALPDPEYFRINSSDKVAYWAYIRKMTALQKDTASMKFYSQAPRLTDTISTALLGAILAQPEPFWSTSSQWLSCYVINSNQDTICFTNTYYSTPKGWLLPWELISKHGHAHCYSLRLSQFIAESLPADFPSRDAFSNKLLLFNIADYLWGERKKQ